MGNLLLILLALLVLGYFYEVWRCGHLKPTGDALFDRYAREVVRRNRWKLFHSRYNHCTSVPDSVLAKWEDDLGSDPRYWELRVQCVRLSRYGLAEPQGMPEFNPSTVAPDRLQREQIAQLIDSAEQHSALDATLEEMRANNHAYLVYDDIDEINATTPLQEPTSEEKATIHKMTEDDVGARLEFLTRAIELDPGNAWPYYERARYWYNLGEGDKGLADLEAGNAAAHNRLFKPFPISFVCDKLADGEVPGNAAVAGAVLESDMATPIEWLEWKDVMKEISLSAALDGDPEPLTAFHQFACRVASADYATLWEFQAAAGLLIGELDYVQTELAGGLTSSQLRALKAERVAAGQLMNRCAVLQARLAGQIWDLLTVGTCRITAYYGTFGNTGTRTYPRREYMQDMVSAKMMLAILIPRYRFGDFVMIVETEQEFQQTDVADCLEELEGFDYGAPDEKVFWMY